MLTKLIIIISAIRAALPLEAAVVPVVLMTHNAPLNFNAALSYIDVTNKFRMSSNQLCVTFRDKASADLELQ